MNKQEFIDAINEADRLPIEERNKQYDLILQKLNDSFSDEFAKDNENMKFWVGRKADEKVVNVIVICNMIAISSVGIAFFIWLLAS